MTRRVAVHFWILAAGLVVLLISLFGVFATGVHAEDVGPNTPQTTSGKPPLPPKPGMGVVGNVREKLQNVREDIKERMGSSTLPKPPRPELGSTTRRAMDGRGPLPIPFASSTSGERPLKERFEEEQDKMKGRMQERQVMLRNELAKKGEEQYTKVLKRLSAALLRLTDIEDRIDSRIKKLEADGIDMTNAKKLLADARTAIANADTKIKAIPEPTFPSTTDASTTPAMINDSLKPTREATKSAEDAIKNAREALMKVVVELKHKGGAKADAEGDENASTTSSGSNH